MQHYITGVVCETFGQQTLLATNHLANRHLFGWHALDNWATHHL